MLDVTFFPKERAGHSKMFLHLDTWDLVLTRLTCQAGSALEVQPGLHTSSEAPFCEKLIPLGRGE